MEVITNMGVKDKVKNAVEEKLDYEKVAKNAVKDLIEEIEPQAEEKEHKDTLDAIKKTKEHLENGDSALLVQDLEELKDLKTKYDYNVDL